MAEKAKEVANEVVVAQKTALTPEQVEAMNMFAINVDSMGFEDVDASDIKMARIKIVQKTSGEVDSDKAKAGQFWNSLSETASDSLNVVIYGFKKQRGRWPATYSRGDKPLCVSYDGKTGTEERVPCDKCPHSNWDKAKAEGKKHPECSENHVWYGVIRETGEPFAFSVSSSGILPSKKFITDVLNRKLHWVVFNVTLESVKETNDQGTYHVIKFNITDQLDFSKPENIAEAQARQNDMVARQNMFATVLRVYANNHSEDIIDIETEADPDNVL